jgi:AcrR family transcriptional regulator
MAAIASAANVSLKTVYVAFDTKSGVLRALWHLLLRGDQADVPVAERDWYREVLDERDPLRKLELVAHNSRRVKERAAALMLVIRSAAPQDPDIAALWDRIQTDFHDNQRTIVASLHERGDLRRGLGVRRGADILWTLNHPDVWHLLVVQRGWTPGEWESWFVLAARSQLLGSGG